MAGRVARVGVLIPSLLVLMSLATRSLAAAVAEPKCYWPDGSIDTAGYVCNITAANTVGGASACCLHDDACYANGVCFQGWSGVMYRQSCTDSSWRNGACPKFCLNANKNETNIGVWIQSCDMAAAKACCVDGKPCCNSTSSADFFNFKPGQLQAVINGDGTNRLGPYVRGDGVTETYAVATTSRTATSSSTISASLDAIFGTSPTQSTSTSAIESDSCSQQSRAPLGSYRIAAAVIGAVLGSLLVTTLGGMWFFWRKFQLERKLRLDAQAPVLRKSDVSSLNDRKSEHSTSSLVGTAAHMGQTGTAYQAPVHSVAGPGHADEGYHPGYGRTQAARNEMSTDPPAQELPVSNLPMSPVQLGDHFGTRI